MGLLSAVKGFFSSGPDAAGKVLDAGIKGIDALVFTNEEKAEYMKKLGDTWIEMLKVLGPETSVRGVTRRILAVLVVGSYTLLCLAAAVVAVFDADFATFLLNVAEGKFGWMALGVMAFYFGPYMLQRMLPGMNGGEKK